MVVVAAVVVAPRPQLKRYTKIFLKQNVTPQDYCMPIRISAFLSTRTMGWFSTEPHRKGPHQYYHTTGLEAESKAAN